MADSIQLEKAVKPHSQQIEGEDAAGYAALTKSDIKTDDQKEKIPSGCKETMKRVEGFKIDDSFSILDQIDTKNTSIEELLQLMTQSLMDTQLKLWTTLKALLQLSDSERQKAMKSLVDSHTSPNMYIANLSKVGASAVPIILLGYDAKGFEKTASFYGQGAGVAGDFAQSFSGRGIELARSTEKVVSESHNDLKQQLEQLINRDFEKVMQTLAQMQQLRMQAMR